MGQFNKAQFPGEFKKHGPSVHGGKNPRFLEKKLKKKCKAAVSLFVWCPSPAPFLFVPFLSFL